MGRSCRTPSSAISRDSTAAAMLCSDSIARGNETRGLPLVDAEVGALLRVLATAIGARPHPGDRHRDRLLGAARPT